MNTRLLVLACLGLLLVSPRPARAQLLSLDWALNPGDRPYLTTNDLQRGMAYNPGSGNVLLVNRAGGLSVNKLKGATGADDGVLDVTGITGGTFPLNVIGVADDGTIYACNLKATLSDGNTKIYRWANEAAAPTVAFSGILATNGSRWGDNFDVRRAGNAIQVLMGQGGSGVGNRITVFTTTDGGLTLMPTTMTVVRLGVGETRSLVACGPGKI